MLHCDFGDKSKLRQIIMFLPSVSDAQSWFWEIADRHTKDLHEMVLPRDLESFAGKEPVFSAVSLMNFTFRRTPLSFGYPALTYTSGLVGPSF
jgi:hypothetical protein